MYADDFTPLGALKFVDAMKLAHRVLTGDRFIPPLSQQQQQEMQNLRLASSIKRLAEGEGEEGEAKARAWTDAMQRLQPMRQQQSDHEAQARKVCSALRKYFHSGHLNAFITRDSGGAQKTVPSRCWADARFFSTAVTSSYVRFYDGGMGDQYTGRLYVGEKEIKEFLAAAVDEPWCQRLRLYDVNDAMSVQSEATPSARPDVSTGLASPPFHRVAEGSAGTELADLDKEAVADAALVLGPTWNAWKAQHRNTFATEFPNVGLKNSTGKATVRSTYVELIWQSAAKIRPKLTLQDTQRILSDDVRFVARSKDRGAE